MPKKHTYFILFAVLLVSITASIQNVKGDAPATVSLLYNTGTQKLNVTILHPVSDPNSHYVATVVIKVNGSTVLTPTYSSQPSSTSFTYQYDVTADDGARIEASATCILGGTTSACIIVGAGLCPTGGGGSGIPGYLGIFLIIGISVIIIATVIYKKKIKKLNN